MLVEFRRIRTREEIYEGIDLWNRLNPSLHIIPQLIEQNIVSPFPNIEVLAWGAFKNNQLIAFALTKYLTSPISDDEALNHGGIEDYWLLWYQDNPVGFVRANTSESAYMGTNVNWGSQWGERYCGLGPFGIADGFRGKGWGTYLAISVIQAFQKQGYSHMVIDWTTLVDYYVKFGFRPWIKYFMIYKKL